jgi:hypothetical protein
MKNYEADISVKNIHPSKTNGNTMLNHTGDRRTMNMGLKFLIPLVLLFNIGRSEERL